MANLRIQVIGQVEEYVSKGDGKGYNKLTVTYKNLATTPPKVEVKNVMDFANKEVYDKLKNCAPNSVLQVTSEKINNYWNWTEVHRDDGPAETVVTVGGATVAGAAPAKTPNTYAENNEINRQRLAFDREKQPLIIRQSSLSTAVDFLKGTKATADDVIALAAKFEQWVNGQSLSQMQDDIPQ